MFIVLRVYNPVNQIFSIKGRMFSHDSAERNASLCFGSVLFFSRCTTSPDEQTYFATQIQLCHPCRRIVVFDLQTPLRFCLTKIVDHFSEIHRIKILDSVDLYDALVSSHGDLDQLVPTNISYPNCNDIDAAILTDKQQRKFIFHIRIKSVYILLTLYLLCTTG